MVVLPYAIKPKDIQAVRDAMGPSCSKVQVLAKIDCLEALHNFEALVKASDGIILNRSELGMELPPEKIVVA